MAPGLSGSHFFPIRPYAITTFPPFCPGTEFSICDPWHCADGEPKAFTAKQAKSAPRNAGNEYNMRIGREPNAKAGENQKKGR